MKKLCLLLFIGILLPTSSSVFAQDDKPSKVGFRAGFHSASLVHKGEKPDSANSLSSFYFGIYSEKKIAPMLRLGSGLEYFQNGLKYTANTKRVMHTISVPVNLKAKLGPVFALGGVSANFKVSEKFIYKDQQQDIPSDSKANWFDVPVYLGAGLKVLFVSVEIRYHWGLLEVKDDYYHRYLQIGAAISF